MNWLHEGSKQIIRYKAEKENGVLIKVFSVKAEIDEWITQQIEERGLDWRVGYLMRFRDGLQVEITKRNGNKIKT